LSPNPCLNGDVALRVGNVEVRGTPGEPWAEVLVDGKPVAWRRLVLEMDLDAPPVVTVELYPSRD
jgi:hypothetical protein